MHRMANLDGLAKAAGLVREERETKAAKSRKWSEVSRPDPRMTPRCQKDASTCCSKRSEKREPKPSFIEIVLRKEVIQPQVPLRLPCYDFTPVADPTVVASLLAVKKTPSGRTNSHGVTGGVYKARERIHRSVLICDY